MNKSLIPALAALVLAPAARAQAAPVPDPVPVPDVKIIRDVTVLSKGDLPHLVQVQRGFFGISTVDLTKELLDHFGVEADGGVLIASVAEDGPADRSGLRVGDVLTEVDGESIESRFDASVVIGRLEPESEVYAKVYRQGRPQTVEVTVGERERGQLPFNWVVAADGVTPAAPGVLHYRFKTGTDDEDVIVFDSQPMREAVTRIRERFDSPEYKARVEVFRERNAELDVRLQELEERLVEMGERLAEALAEIRQPSGAD